MNANTRFFAACALGAALAPLPAAGAYLESDVRHAASIPETRESRTVKPVPTVVPDNPAAELLKRVTVGAPSYYRSLAVFPILLRRPQRTSQLVTLDEAIRRDWIVIREQSEAQVSEIEIRNDSRHMVFLMAGEILAGGKQNRMVRDDILLPAHSRFIAVPVYCGEKERWSASRKTFTSPGILAHPFLRGRAAGRASQSAIWAEIDTQSKRAGISSPTRDYQHIYENASVQRELAECARRFRRLPGRRTVGIVAVNGNRILGCDVFSDPSILSELWDKLIRSYGMDSLYSRRRGEVSRRDVRRFLDRAVSARYRKRHTPGAGQLLEVSGQATGAALIWAGQAVHVGLFGDIARRPPPPRREPPRPWPRRDGVWR